MAAPGCHNNGAGGGQTPNPFLKDFTNPFQNSHGIGMDTARQFQSFLSLLFSVLISQAGSVLGWIIAVYVGVSLSATLMLWSYSLVRYYRDATKAVVVGLSWKQPSHAPWRILWAILLCLSSILVAPVVGLLWPLWMPMVVIQLGLWLVYNGMRLCFSLVSGAWIVLSGIITTLMQIKVLRRVLLVPFSITDKILGSLVPQGSHVKQQAQQNDQDDRLDNHLSQLSDNLQALHKAVDEGDNETTSSTSEI